MRIKDFKVAWRLLIKEAGFSSVVIAGLSLGIAASFLLLGLVAHQMRFDSHVPENEKIFLLKERWDTQGLQGWQSTSSLSAQRSIVESGLPVLSTAIGHQNVDMRVGDAVHDIDVALVDEQFSPVFSINSISGDLTAAIKRPDTIALSAETAQTLYGTENPLGKTVRVAGKTYTISAILPTPLVTSSIQYQAVTGVHSTMVNDGIRQNWLDNWGSIGFNVYVKTLGQVQATEIISVVERAREKSQMYLKFILPLMQQTGKTQIISHQLIPLRKQNLDPDLAGGWMQNIRILQGLAIVALAILLLATTNYVNLSQVRALQRQREIAMHKVLGASAQRIIMQFMLESIAVCMLAASVGMGLAWLLLPNFSEFLGLKLDDMFSWASVLLCFVGAILLGALSGILPAYSALKVLPSAALMGRGDQEAVQGQRTRRILTVVQMSAALALSASALAVAWQSHFLTNQSIGYDPNPLITLHLNYNTNYEQVKALAADLEKLDTVTHVAMSNNAIRAVQNSDTLVRKGYPMVHTKILGVSLNFFAAHGIQALAGRVFDPNLDLPDAQNKMLANYSAALLLGFSSPEVAVGQFIQHGNQELQIIGVLPDLKNRDPKKTSDAVVYFPHSVGTSISLRSNGDKLALQDAITEVWMRHFPDTLLRMQTANAELATEHSTEKNMAWLLALASVMSLAIAAFGIYVLAAYSVQKRSKEIVLRKLYGAKKSQLLRFVGQEFLILIGLACVIALPLAHRYIQSYLSEYVEHAPIGGWTLLAATVIGILVAALATLTTTLKALRMTPLHMLRE